MFIIPVGWWGPLLSFSIWVAPPICFIHFNSLLLAPSFMFVCGGGYADFLVQWVQVGDRNPIHPRRHQPPRSGLASFSGGGWRFLVAPLLVPKNADPWNSIPS